jgi:hypothetical protein
MSEDVEPVRLNHAVSFTPGQFGAGVMMFLERGIPCAEHTQVFSAHTTDSPDIEDIRKAVEKNKDSLNKQMGAFVDLANALGHTPATESIADVFFGDLVRRVAELAYRNFCERN